MKKLRIFVNDPKGKMHRQEVVNRDNNKRGSALVKMALLLMFIAAAIYLVRSSSPSF
jgi:hypothetical protein